MSVPSTLMRQNKQLHNVDNRVYINEQHQGGTYLNSECSDTICWDISLRSCSATWARASSALDDRQGLGPDPDAGPGLG